MQREDGARLFIRQADLALVVHDCTSVRDQADQRAHVHRRPRTIQQRHARGIRVSRITDDADDLVDVCDSKREADQHVGPVARLVQLELGPPCHHFLAEADERLQHGAKVHQFGATAIQSQHVDAERGLHRRQAVEIVQHDVGGRIALDLDHHTDAGAIALVAQVGDTFDLLLAHQLGDLLDHAGLVHLERHLGDNNRLTAALHGLDLGLGAHDD